MSAATSMLEQLNVNNASVAAMNQNAATAATATANAFQWQAPAVSTVSSKGLANLASTKKLKLGATKKRKTNRAMDNQGPKAPKVTYGVAKLRGALESNIANAPSANASPPQRAMSPSRLLMGNNNNMGGGNKKTQKTQKQKTQKQKTQKQKKGANKGKGKK